MTDPKAIELLKDCIQSLSQANHHKHAKAVQKGIEALQLKIAKNKEGHK